MSATAIAEPIARKNAAGLTDFTICRTDAGIPRTQAATPESLTAKERKRLWAASKDYDEFTDKAIAFGKLTGDFTIDRHILPEPTWEEIQARIDRHRAAHPERLTIKPEQVKNLAQ
jgi:hypothetical protein